MRNTEKSPCRGGCTSLLGGGENSPRSGSAEIEGGCTSLLGGGENVERLHANCLEGGWLRNGARAKSGLNKSILASAWGQTQTYLQYKARRQGKLVVSVPPFFSSQECAACGHVLDILPSLKEGDSYYARARH